MEILRQASVLVLLGMVVSTAPLVMGVLVAIRPDERRLALMRPLSLAGIFAAVSTMLLGVINALTGLARADHFEVAMIGYSAAALSEAAVPVFVGFACQTAGWLCVAIGLRRSTV